MSTSLRPYQLKAEKEIYDAWREGHHCVMFQLVTGGGKTVIFVEIIKKILMKGKRVILIAHREELIMQAWETLHKNKIFAGIIKSGIAPNFSLPCQVASIQTIYRRKELPHADFVIFDEAHHCQDDNTYGNVLIDHFGRSRVLGVTATPYRLGGKGFTNLFNKLICGPPFKDLVNQGWLTPFRYFIASRPDLDNVRVQGGDYVIEDAARAMGNAPLVQSYREHCEGMRGIVFAVNIAHSNKIVDQYNAAGIPAAHIDGDTPTEQRRAIIKRFKEGKIRVMCNVGIFTEGFDAPDMDFVQLARPTKSLSLFLQMIGRATRTIWDAIKDCTSDAERAAAVAASRKPYCYILDNASLFEEHGLPDQVFDWDRYFNGIPKRKKKLEEFIEVVDYVVEDEEGNRSISRHPEELEGLKLVDVTHHIKEQIVNLVTLKEFDKGLEMYKRIPHITKPGYVAVKNYKDYCRKNSVLMSPEVWDYIKRKLCTEPEKQISIILSDRDQRIATAYQMYAGNPEELANLKRVINSDADKKMAPYQKIMISKSFLEKERALYEAAINASKSGKEVTLISEDFVDQ